MGGRLSVRVCDGSQLFAIVCKGRLETQIPHFSAPQIFLPSRPDRAAAAGEAAGHTCQ